MSKAYQLCLLLMLGAAAHAQDAPPRVTVAATRDPVDKSYRKMVAGMDRFERNHALAPQAALRFELLPRLPTTQLRDITLRVAGETSSMPVRVAPDHTFTLERNPQLLKEDAALIASRKTSTLTWRAQVRSPGVPAGMRRLGDLRLECQVGVEAGLVSNNSKFFAWLGDLFADADKVCSSPEGNYLFFADHPVFSVTLHDGARTATLPFRALYAGGTQTTETLPFCDCQVLLDRSYYAPIWDRNWSDDTLLSFEEMDAPPGPGDVALSPGYASKAQMRGKLGDAEEIRFDSGLEVWRYNYPPEHAASGQDGRPLYAEFVILFGADGAALKARKREP